MKVKFLSVQLVAAVVLTDDLESLVQEAIMPRLPALQVLTRSQKTPHGNHPTAMHHIKLVGI